MTGKMVGWDAIQKTKLKNNQTFILTTLERFKIWYDYCSFLFPAKLLDSGKKIVILMANYYNLWPKMLSLKRSHISSITAVM